MKTPRNSRRLPAKRLVILAAFQPLEAWGASDETSLSFRPFLEVQGLPQAQPMVFHLQGQRPAPAGVPKLGGFTDRAFTLEAGTYAR